MPNTLNPILVEVVRGDMVESRHRGRYALYQSDGTLSESVGFIDNPVYARSTLKFIQALPLVETGAANSFSLSDEELVLACSSHAGEPSHTNLIANWLGRIGLTTDDLECGLCAPQDPATAKSLIAEGKPHTTLHNPCSGKHSNFLSIARHLGVRSAGYVDRAHPVQGLVEKAISEICDTDLSSSPAGIDGCSIPVYGIPLKKLALGFARFSDPSLHELPRRQAIERFLKAVQSFPHLVAGTDRFDTKIIQALKGKAIVKVGAEGVYAGIFPSLKMGIALKIEDGSIKAAEVAMARVLEKLGLLSDLDREEKKCFLTPPVNSLKKKTVGHWRAAF